MTERSLEEVVCALFWEVLSGRKKVETPAQTKVNDQKNFLPKSWQRTGTHQSRLMAYPEFVVSMISSL